MNWWLSNGYPVAKQGYPLTQRWRVSCESGVEIDFSLLGYVGSGICSVGDQRAVTP